MNCWDVMKCGREANGSKVSEFGVCPAYLQKAGDACWLVAGTFCNGTVQGSAAQKKSTCLVCSAYKQFDVDHKLKKLDEYGF